MTVIVVGDMSWATRALGRLLGASGQLVMLILRRPLASAQGLSSHRLSAGHRRRAELLGCQKVRGGPIAISDDEAPKIVLWKHL